MKPTWSGHRVIWDRKSTIYIHFHHNNTIFIYHYIYVYLYVYRQFSLKRMGFSIVMLECRCLNTSRWRTMALWSSGVGKYRHQGILGGSRWNAAAGGDFEVARYAKWLWQFFREPPANFIVLNIFPSNNLAFGGHTELSDASKFVCKFSGLFMWGLILARGIASSSRSNLVGDAKHSSPFVGWWTLGDWKIVLGIGLKPTKYVFQNRPWCLVSTERKTLWAFPTWAASDDLCREPFCMVGPPILMEHPTQGIHCQTLTILKPGADSEPNWRSNIWHFRSWWMLQRWSTGGQEF